MKNKISVVLIIILLCFNASFTSSAKYYNDEETNSTEYVPALNSEMIANRNQIIETKESQEEYDKISPSLASLLEPNSNNARQDKKDVKEILRKREVLVTPKEAKDKGLQATSEDLVYVYIQLSENAQIGVADKYLNTIDNKDEEAMLLAAWIPISNISTVAALSDVLLIEPVMPPIVNSVISDGDIIHNADAFRDFTGLGGEGIKIGVISNGVNNWTDSRDAGELPNITVLNDRLVGDEGTAMMEIIYDLAPNAELYFHDNGQNTIAFKEAIEALADSGCNIIVDDVGWPSEPYFEDGTIARYLKKLLTKSKNDLIYITAAGNSGISHYQNVFVGDENNFNDFSSNEGSQSLPVFVPPYGLLQVVLQWDDRFGRSSNDYDLYLFDENYSVLNVDGGMSVQNGRSNPMEYTYYYNTTSDIQVIYVDIHKYHGVEKTLELYVFGGYVLDYGTSEDSIYGHAAVPEVVSVGAINVNNYDGTPNTTNEIAGYSSRGNVTIKYPQTQIRSKPDICGVSGVSVTGTGGFPSTFYGTSASAPHIAAITALIWSQAPNNKASEVKSILLNSTNDLGEPGYDPIYGYGLSDMTNAILSPAKPTGLSATAADKSVILTWDPNADLDISSYQVSYKLADATKWTNITVSKANTTATISNLINGSEYQFKIRAIKNKKYYSAYSEIITETPFDNVPPAAPTNLKVTSVKRSNISLSWKAPKENDLFGYQLEYKKSNEDAWSEIDLSTVTKYTLTNLDSNEEYCFRIMAIDTSNNCSPYSNIVIGVTK